MVGAVYHGCFPVQRIKTGILFDFRGMVLVTILIAVDRGIGHILQNRSAEGNINDLHAFADAKNREMKPQTDINGLELQDIQFRVNIAGTHVALSEKGGRDIASPGQYQPIAFRQDAGA